MAASIEIEVREIRGPCPYVFIQLHEQVHVMRVVPAHYLPRPFVPPHTAEPEMLSSMGELASDTQVAASGIQLVRIQAELFAEYFEGVDCTVRRWGLELVVYKPGVGFLEIEGVAVMCDGNVTRAEQLVQLFYKHPVLVKGFFVSWKIRQGSHGDLTIASPTVGEA